MKDVQCYELFGGIALKNHTFSFFFIFICKVNVLISYKDIGLAAKLSQLIVFSCQPKTVGT